MKNQNHALRALIVDDEPHVLRLTEMALTREGFQCDLAGDGEQAEQQLAETRYDVVVTDLQMPHRNGHALAADLLQRSERPLIVVLTGLADPALAQDLLARGVDDIVFKPVNFLAFAAKVRTLVNRHREQTAAAPASVGA